MEQENQELLAAGLAAFGVETAPAGRAAITLHLKLVAEWNERVNLTAITGEREMVIKHAVDSAAAWQVMPLRAGLRVLDVGTGAGFPGVVWKCLEPGIQLTLLESLQKRCNFLAEVGRALAPLVGEGGYRVVWSRAEDAGHQAEHREQYDLVTARAVADFRVLAEYCLPFVRVGGHFLALKGPGVVTEIEAAARAIRTLGGRVEQVVEVQLPYGAGARSLVLVRKEKATPGAYPRKAGTPAKSPL